MILRLLVLALALPLVPLPTGAQERLPIIDMHLHTGMVGGDLSLGLCVPGVTQFPRGIRKGHGKMSGWRR